MKYFFTLLTFILASAATHAQGFTVTLEAPQYDSGLAYLVYYYGKSRNIEDSANLNAQGTAVFHDENDLQPGVYSIVFPGKSKFYDFLVDKEQIISINADTNDLLNKTTVKGSKENILFQQYQQFASEKGAQIQQQLTQFRTADSKSDSLLHENKYKELYGELNNYREEIIKENPNSMLTALLMAMREPQSLNMIPHTKADSAANYQYYKKHYWDGISFMDDRIIRTPFFVPKVQKYFDEVISQAPDSIIKEAEHLLLLSRSSPEMFKFLLNWLTDKYIYPKYMGQDKVFVFLFEKYHSKGVSNWLNEKQMETITNRAYMVMSNLIGEQAANMEMVNTTGEPSPLYNLKADFTVVAFWDPTCSHCKTEMPTLDSFYRAKWKAQGVKIYAVLTEPKEIEKWNVFIKEHQLQEFENVYEPTEQKEANEKLNIPSYKQLYDVLQTPTLYLLDKEKRIVAKKLTLEQLDELIDVKIKNPSTESLKKADQ